MLFYKARYHELAPQLADAKELNFEVANIFIDIDNKRLILDTNNGRADINFDDYDKLLDAIIRVGKELYIRDMLDSLDRARDDLMFNRRNSHLMMAENEIDKLLRAIEKAKKDLLDGNFTLVIELGDLGTQYIDSLVDSYPEIKNAIEDGIERYRELCWKTYESDVPNYCDHVVPVINATVYAVPEDKRVIIVISVDMVGEVYRVVKGYDDARDFLKAIEEYQGIVVSH